MNEENLAALIRAAEDAEDLRSHPSTRLQSRIYSALMLAEAAQGPLRPLDEVADCGGGLCVFEKLVAIAPAGQALKSYNYCRICHGRLVGEYVEKPPLGWEGCPYAQFKKT